MKVITIIQARTTSQRLPNKVLLDMCGISLLARVVNQARKINFSDNLWVATSDDNHDDLIDLICKRIGVNCYRGDLEDVRSRFVDISRSEKADLIVRLTADNPLSEPSYANQLIHVMIDQPKLDYARMNAGSVLYGSGSEVIRASALEKSVRNYYGDDDKEHVTASIIEKMPRTDMEPVEEHMTCHIPYSVTVDTYEDYTKMCRLIDHFGEENTLGSLIKVLHKDGHMNQGAEL